MRHSGSELRSLALTAALASERKRSDELVGLLNNALSAAEEAAIGSEEWQCAAHVGVNRDLRLHSSAARCLSEHSRISQVGSRVASYGLWYM